MTKTIKEIKDIIEECKNRLGKLGGIIDKANIKIEKAVVETKIMEGRIETLEDMLNNPENYPNFELKEGE